MYRWALTLNGELDYLLRGKNTSYIRYQDVKFTQKSGYGLRLAVKFEKDFQYVGFFAEPFFRYWNISKSNVVASNNNPGWGYIEPKNRTTELGLRIGVLF
jgi:hypothetical protein